MASRHLQAILGDATNLQPNRLDGKRGTKIHQKRVAEKSPDAKILKKRPAFGDITNAVKISQAKAKVEKQIKKVVIVKSRRKPEVVQKRKASPAKKWPTAILFPEEEEERYEVPPGVNDFDAENIGDPFQEPTYSMDIFNYYKKREIEMKVNPYIEYQPGITQINRMILVDWMVEVQESFELNHETLYLAVKLVDSYLMKTKATPIIKSHLQLVGATSIFVACKFDERIPPLIDDFLYICEDAYTRKEFIQMEIKILKTVDFDLGNPLSYRFLRRYARTAKLTMEVLTLSRYILEMSLMKYEFISERDSLMAAAALSLALQMKNRHESDESLWSATLAYYSGYGVKELRSMVDKLNLLISQPLHKKINVIKTKYSHKVFFEVAKIAPLDLSV